MNVCQYNLKDFAIIFNCFRSSEKITDLLEIIFYLEAAVGEAINEEMFIQKLVLREKQTFYGYYGEEMPAMIGAQ